MANRYLVSGGTGNWNSTTNWSTIDGGVAGASFPVAGDIAYFTTNSGATNITVNVASACTSVIASGTYSGVLRIDDTLTVGGTVTFIATMGLAGTGTLICTTTATLTSAGLTLPGNLTYSGNAQTYTMADNWTVTGTVSITGTSSVFNTNYVYIGGDFLIPNLTTGNISGSTSFYMNGTGSFIMASVTTGYIRNTITFNGTITTPGLLRFANSAGGVSLILAGGTLNSIGGTFALGTPAGITCNAAGFTLDTVTFISTAGAVSFAGTNGFTINTLNKTATWITLTLQAGNTYEVASDMTLIGTAPTNMILVSSTPGTHYYLNLLPTATHDLGYVNCTDADSSGGNTVWDWKGTLTNTINWNLLINPGTVGTMFII